ncbi:MAG: hypothetical protein R3A46_06585 [Thermomicrobiales bacterium]
MIEAGLAAPVICSYWWEIPFSALTCQTSNVVTCRLIRKPTVWPGSTVSVVGLWGVSEATQVPTVPASATGAMPPVSDATAMPLTIRINAMTRTRQFIGSVMRSGALVRFVPTLNSLSPDDRPLNNSDPGSAGDAPARRLPTQSGLKSSSEP